jgi:hypothetical protein
MTEKEIFLERGEELVSQNGSYGNGFYRKILLAYNSIFKQFPMTQGLLWYTNGGEFWDLRWCMHEGTFGNAL